MPTPLPDQYRRATYPVKFSADPIADQLERSDVDQRGGCWAEIIRCYDLISAVKAGGVDLSSFVPSPRQVVIAGRKRNRYRDSTFPSSQTSRILQLEADLKQEKEAKLDFENQAMGQISYVEEADNSIANLLRKRHDLPADINSFTNFGTYLNQALEVSSVEQICQAKIKVQEKQTLDILSTFMGKTSIEEDGQGVTKKINTCLKSIFDLKSLVSSDNPAQLSEVVETVQEVDLVGQMVEFVSLLRLDEGQGNGHDKVLVATKNVHCLEEDDTESGVDVPSVKRLKPDVESTTSTEFDETSTTSAVPSESITIPTVTADFVIYDAVKEQFDIDAKSTHTFDVSTVPEIMDLEGLFRSRAASSLGIPPGKVHFIIKRERLDDPVHLDISDAFTYRSWARCMLQLQGCNKRCVVLAWNPEVKSLAVHKAARQVV